VQNLPKHVLDAVKSGTTVYHFEPNDARVFSLYRGIVISEPLPKPPTQTYQKSPG